MNTVKINLLPSEIKKKRAAEKGFVLLIGVMVIVIGICSLITAFLFMKAATETRGLEAKKQEILSINNQIKAYDIYKEREKQVKAHETALQKVIDNEIYWHRFINEMSMIIPSDITLGTLKLDEAGTITIEGAGFEYEKVAELLVRLTDLDMIQNIWLQKAENEKMEVAKLVGVKDAASDGEGGGEEEIEVYGVGFTIVATLKAPTINAQASK